MSSGTRKSDQLLYELYPKGIYMISGYYFSLLLIGIVASIYVMIKINDIEQAQLMAYTITASLSISGMMCSIQYLKRIYKACINKRVIEPPPRQKLVQFGNLLYFFLRPIYSFVFVVIAIFAMLSGLIIITASVDYVLNERFLYLSVIISSFIGFSTGRVLDRFEELSNKKVDETLKVEKGVIR